MRSKYIRLKRGGFIIFSEGLGTEHASMALYANAFIDDISDAGFVYLENGRFHVWGRSLSLDLSCDQFAADDMNRALSSGKLKLFPYRDDFIASNLSALPGDPIVVRSPDELSARRIISD